MIIIKREVLEKQEQQASAYHTFHVQSARFYFLNKIILGIFRTPDIWKIQNSNNKNKNFDQCEVHTVWHEQFAGVLFCGFENFCGLREQIFTIEDD